MSTISKSNDAGAVGGRRVRGAFQNFNFLPASGRVCTARLLRRAALVFPLLGMFLAINVWGQTNSTITLTTNQLRDRLYDAATASTLLRAPIYGAVLHLVDEATRKSPGILSAADTVDVITNVIGSMMTNDFGNNPQLTLQDLASRALPFLQQELSKKLPPNTVNAIQTGLSIAVLAEQQGFFSSVYSNLTTAIPSGVIFSDVENTASGIEAYYRQAASQVAALALPERIRASGEQAFRDAAAQVMSQVTSITPEDALDTILQNIPGLTNSAVVTNLLQKIQTAGQIIADLNSIETNLATTLDSLHQSISDGVDQLGQLASAQEDIIGSLTNLDVLNNAATTAEEISSSIADNIDLAQTSINLASTLFKLGGNPKVAQQIATVGGAAVNVANAVKGVSDAIDAEGGLFSASSVLASGNLIGAALDVFSMFGGASSSPDDVILGQISAVRQDIANLQQDMDARFNQVDAALTNIMGSLDYQLGVITNGFQNVENNLGQIRVSLLDLQGQVQRLESETYSWIQALGDRDLNLALNVGLGYEDQYGLPMSYDLGNQNFITYEGTFYTWAFNNSSDSLSEPNSGDFSVFPGLYAQLQATNSPENSVAYINNFIAGALLQPKPFGGTLANPRVWSVTANAYSQLCVENPGWFRAMPSTAHLQNIIAAGNNLQTFLNNLIAFGTNAPNTNLWAAACNGYASAVQGLTNAIQASLSLYASTNGLPANFNPFASRYLSVVASNAATMSSGYYATSSVVSVPALACSPTSDGMPIYFLDQNALRRLDTNGMITTLAGSAVAGFLDGPAALLNGPQGLAVGFDRRVYIADTGNHAIRVYDTNGLNTLAGYPPGTTNTIPVAGAADGTNGTARFNSPRGLLIDRQGDLLVADTMNHAVRRVTPAGVVTTLAGTLGKGGLRNGTTPQAAFSAARFVHPEGVAMDNAGSLYVADRGNQMLRRLTPTGGNWQVSTIASRTNGLLGLPAAVTVDSSNNVYVADAGYDEILLFSPAGPGWATNLIAGGTYGQNDGTSGAAQFYFPSAISLDSAGELFVADTGNSTIRRIRRIGSSWQVVTIAGSPQVAAFANGTNRASLFSWPYGIAVQNSNTVYVADSGNGVIRGMKQVGTNWVVTTLAGTPSVFTGVDGTNGGASFGSPMGIAIDPGGNLYVADAGANTIRRVSPVGTNWVVTTIAGSNGQTGSADGTGSEATFSGPSGITVDTNGNLFVTDQYNNTVREITPVGTNWMVTTIAGTPDSLSRYADTPAIAQFWTPEGLAQDTNGVIYVTDRIGSSIRTIDTNGMVSPFTNAPGLLTLVLPGLLTANSGSIPSSVFGDQLACISAGGEPAATSTAYYNSPTIANHALGLSLNGTVTAWGDNTYGQCSVLAGLTNVVAIAAGGTYSLGATADGFVKQWGSDSGSGPYNQIQEVAAGPTSFVFGCCPPVMGWGHALAIVNAARNVAAWSTGNGGGFGEINVPPGLSNVVGIAAGLGHSLALTADGLVIAFGSGNYLVLGDYYVTNQGGITGIPGGMPVDSFVVSHMPAGLTNVVAISDTYAHALAVKSDGTVTAWGFNPAGECNVPSGLSNVVAVAAGRAVSFVRTPIGTNGNVITNAGLPTGSHSLALRSDGTVVAWGNNVDGQCNVPAGLSNVVDISAGAGVSFALKRDGTVVSWGDNSHGLDNVVTPSQSQAKDTPAANAALQQLTAGVFTPDGRFLVADRFGLRLFDYSDRLQRQAAAYLANEFANSSGTLNRAGNTNTAWHLLLQTLATYALSDPLASDDAMHALLFGNDPLVDTSSATAFLSGLAQKSDWRPTHVELGAKATQQINVLQSRLLSAVTQLAQKPNPASLPMVSDTLNRLNLLIATHGLAIPAPALSSAATTNHMMQVLLNGYPYVDYALASSPNLQSWTTNSVVVHDGGMTNVNTRAAGAGFYRAVQVH